MGKYRSPITGYNHNVRHRGWVFHVQTEDSGVQNPHIFTHCFNGGVIVNTKKMVYDAIADAEIVKALMQAQHKSVLRELKKGAYDEKIDRYLGAPPEGVDEGAVDGPVDVRPVTLPPGAAIDSSPELALGTPIPELLDALAADAAALTGPIPVVHEHDVVPERMGAPAAFGMDGVPQPVDDEVTAASSMDDPGQHLTIEADAPEGLEARVAGLPGMPSIEPGRWQIREPAANEIPPAGPAPVPHSTWVVRAGGYQESPFEQSRPIHVDEERAAATHRAPLTQPRQATSIPASSVTFTSPREGAELRNRVAEARAPMPRPDEPPSGAFTINNRARKSISADLMGPENNPSPSRSSAASSPAPWEAQPTPSRVEPRPTTSSGGGAPAIRPTGARVAQGAPVRPAQPHPSHPSHPSGTPGVRATPPSANVIVSRPVVLGQRDPSATIPNAHPHAVRVPPVRTASEPAAPYQAGGPGAVVSEKSLDEVILAYLSEEQKQK